MAKKHVFPNNECADYLRGCGADVKIIWEIKGPPKTDVAWLSCYLVNGTTIIVETFSDGWEAFTPNPSGKVSETIVDILSRCPKR